MYRSPSFRRLPDMGKIHARRLLEDVGLCRTQRRTAEHRTRHGRAGRKGRRSIHEQAGICTFQGIQPVRRLRRIHRVRAVRPCGTSSRKHSHGTGRRCIHLRHRPRDRGGGLPLKEAGLHSGLHDASDIRISIPMAEDQRDRRTEAEHIAHTSIHTIEQTVSNSQIAVLAVFHTFLQAGPS